ncbi:MAG: discoidin domain-containing protein [Verrucomicrobiales bacterium]|nr:discoidin domain-containing protein [Verrucomicrobiales bacterium]
MFVITALSPISAWAEVDENGLEQEVPFEMPSDLLEPNLRSRSDLGDRLARMLSSELRHLELRQSVILGELENLPQFSLQSIKPVEFGYHANPNRQRPKWVQLDFGKEIAPDAVVLIPVTVQFQGRSVPGYGFPKAFRVDISNDDKFTTYETLVDYHKEEGEVFRQAPFFAEVPVGLVGRYVRLTVTQLWSAEGGGANSELFALAEMMLLKGARNLSCRQRVTARDSVERGALWSRSFVNDGRTPLGIAHTPEISPTFGYSSQASKKVDKKWVQVDLAEERVIDEVTLIPANPDNFVFDLNTGFPEKFEIQISSDAQFRESVTVASLAPYAFRNPGDNPVTCPVDGVKGRYVRVLVRRHRPNGGLTFALAELQVYSGNQNVALGKKVTALDSLERGKWSGRFLVDGYSSRFRLSPLNVWLQALQKRGQLIDEWRDLDKKRIDLVQGAVALAFRISIAALILVGLLLVVAVLRSRMKQLKTMESLRNQIASDLHDDIGSNLSSIALLAELGGSELDDPKLARSEFEQIKRTADQTVESMRDIVWLIQPGDESWKDFLRHFRETAARMLKHTDYQFIIDGVDDAGSVPLSFRRELFLIFKEVLNNTVKHAKADKVEIQLILKRKVLSLTVTDNGRGFSEEDDDFRGGNGLLNIRRRAQNLGAQIDVDSQQGQGTVVKLRAVLP